MEARRSPRRDSDKELVTNVAQLKGAMEMLRDQTISAVFRERLHAIATEAIGKLALIANEDERLSVLKDELTAALDRTDRLMPPEPSEQHKTA